jgi:membrane-associated protease RseP (regulator of RpoE activity)
MSDYSESFYQEKPVIIKEEPRSSGKSTLVSLVIFALSLLLFFGDEYRFMLELIAVLIIHELGHFITMKRFKYEGVRMLFVPLMGGFVQGDKEQLSQRESLLVAFSGPIPGIIIGTTLWVLGTNWNSAWMLESAYLFFFLNVSNLLPLQPLDGGRVFKSLFIEKFEFIQIGFTFVSSLVLIGIGFYFEFYILMLFGFVMGVTVRNMHRKYLIHQALLEENVNYKVTYDGLTNKDYAAIKKEVLNYSPTIKKFADIASNDDTSDFDQIVAKEVKNNLIQPITMDMGVFSKVLALFLWLTALIGPILLMTLSSIA